MGLFKPNVEQLEKKRNVKKLIVALEYKTDLTVRKKAAIALGTLKDTSAIPALEACLLRETDRQVVSKIADALRNIGYHPQQNEVGAKYAVLINDYDFCVRCGITFAVPNLFSKFIALREGDGYFYNRWREAYLQLGNEGYRYITPLFEQIYIEYKQFIANIKEMNLGLDEDKQKAVVIKHYSHKLCQLIQTIAQYKDVTALVYLTNIYKRVQQEIYSNPVGGLHDMFNAMDIRKSIVNSFVAFDVAVHFEKLVSFLSNVLTTDESDFIRWQAVLVLGHWPVEMVRQNAMLVGALEIALQNVPSGAEHSGIITGRQKQKIHEILGTK